MTEAFKQIPALLCLAVCHLQHSRTASVHLPKCQSMCLSGISQSYCFQIPGTLSRSIHTYSDLQWPEVIHFQWKLAIYGDMIDSNCWGCNMNSKVPIKASQFTRQPFWQHSEQFFSFLASTDSLYGSIFLPHKGGKIMLWEIIIMN